MKWTDWKMPIDRKTCELFILNYIRVTGYCPVEIECGWHKEYMGYVMQVTKACKSEDVGIDMNAVREILRKWGAKE